MGEAAAYSFAMGDVVVCLHVFGGFKSGQSNPDEDHVVCQLNTDAGKINVASCRGCLEKLLQGAPDAWGNYRTVNKQQAVNLGIHIADPPAAAV